MRPDEAKRPATTNLPKCKMCPAIWAGTLLHDSKAESNLELNYLATLSF